MKFQSQVEFFTMLSSCYVAVFLCFAMMVLHYMRSSECISCIKCNYSLCFFFKTEALKDISQELLCTRLVLGPLYEQDRHSSYLPRTRGPPWQMPNAFLLSSNVLAYMCCLWVDSTFRLCLRLCPYNVQWDHWFGSGLINANFGRLSSLLFLNQTYVGTKVT